MSRSTTGQGSSALLPDLMTTADLAQLFNTTDRNVRRMRASGTGPPFIDLGERTIRYDREVVVQWLQSRTRRMIDESA